MGRALFVYYKVDAAHAETLRAAVRLMQAALLRSDDDLQARLWTRADSPDGHQTWMESYEHQHGVSDELAEMIDQAAKGLPAGQLGPRHLEMFESR